MILTTIKLNIVYGRTLADFARLSRLNIYGKISAICNICDKINYPSLAENLRFYRDLESYTDNKKTCAFGILKQKKRTQWARFILFKTEY
ncbi:hypothetical protein C1638_007470 [Chryseobacterium oncorhynchi]|uniref:Uncharacterized protein n=1 Tax=Chryseobacterium oncorhynchi TaxID=741074 RepID=A0A316WY37_9FLAO|nr:hypothetical protein C1638_007470 [Chryseobacterium oncorhynchi]